MHAYEVLLYEKRTNDGARERSELRNGNEDEHLPHGPRQPQQQQHRPRRIHHLGRGKSFDEDRGGLRERRVDVSDIGFIANNTAT